MLILLLILNAGISKPTFIVKIPKAEILYIRFRSTTFIHFIDHTDIIEKLAGKDIEILDVFDKVTIAIQEYVKRFKSAKGIGLFHLDIIELILKDSPKEFKELKAIIDENQNNAAD